MIDRLDRANLQWELVRLADLIEREAESIRVLTDRGRVARDGCPT